MKNRTVIGIICIVLALVLCFGVAPLIGRLTDGTVEVVKVKSGVTISGGTVITEEQIDKAKAKKSDFQDGIYYTYSEFSAKYLDTTGDSYVGIPYAACDLTAGEFVAKTKVSENGVSSDAALDNLGYDKVAVSVNVSFSQCLSGKLDKGDIVSAIIVSGDTGTTIPDELRYVKVISVTASSAVDKDDMEPADNGGLSESIATVTLEASEEQAKILVMNDGEITFVLQCKGTSGEAESYLKTQDEILAQNLGGQTNV